MLTLEPTVNNVALRGRIIGMKESGATTVMSVMPSVYIISKETVRRRLHEAVMHHRMPVVKGKLDERHRLTRLQFTREYQADKGLDFWGRVIFSEENIFLSTTHGNLHCWRRNNSRYLRQNIYEKGRSGRVTWNVWVWIYLYGLGELTHIEEKFNSESYVKILEEVMVPSVRAMTLPILALTLPL
ncbi:hypothetical protein Pmani_003644 [Petrolisthes manimaculis]|uniref:Transposase Tc1-like domain-containing protein n=1 Tax=Petrolisthes manimaculis TaxID=1843537 RepID=A0AAE1UP07_9EUCA|nr:hypothetical protein Pmani_003644 [Petrolisthes manimaculis]